MIDINTYKNIFGTNPRTDCMKSKITIQPSDRELKKETIIQIFKDDPNLFNEIITEFRKYKINKIRNK